ncbi:hypothetical protein [Stieleria sp.]|uniref:hypothetical protein n=1 Tax=Stieleria sp. TaxID=2795976 RepID=UPI00356A4C64
MPTYSGTVHVSDQQMLAVALSAVAALLGFMSCRLIQLRGKLTLAMLVVGLPFVASLVLVTTRHLQPFVQRERSISILRGTRMQFRVRSASQVGEWQRDQSGNMLPTWVATRIGPDCLSQLTTLSGSLSELQSVRFTAIDRSVVSRIALHRVFGDSGPIAPELIDWLNGTDAATIQFSLSNFTTADGEALAGLRNKYQLTIENVDSLTGDLSRIKTAKRVKLYGESLSEEQARQLAQLSATEITLDGFRLSPNVIECLNDQSISDHADLLITHTSIDVPTLDAILRLRDRSIELRNVRLPTLSRKMQVGLRTERDVDASLSPGAFSVLVNGGNLTISDVHRLIALFRCKRLHIDLAPSETDIDSLWEFSCLKQVHIRNPVDDRWTEHARVNDAVQ